MRMCVAHTYACTPNLCACKYNSYTHVPQLSFVDLEHQHTHTHAYLCTCIHTYNMHIHPHAYRRMCVYTHATCSDIHTYMHAYMHACMQYIHTYILRHVNVHKRTSPMFFPQSESDPFSLLHVCICVFIYVTCIFNVHLFMFVFVHARMYACIYVCMHAFMYVSRKGSPYDEL